MKIETQKLMMLNTLFSSVYDDLDIMSNEDGWNVYSQSLDHVTLMSARIPASAFEDYEILPRFEVPVKKLAEALKNMGKTVKVSMTKDYARLILESDGFKMKIPLPPSLDANRMVPKLNYSCGFVSDLEMIRKVANASKSGTVRIKVDSEKLSVSSLDESDCGPSAEVPTASLISVEGEASAGYGTTYFQSFLSKFPKNSVASFEFGTDMPASISYVIDDVEGAFLVAPMVEDRRW